MDSSRFISKFKDHFIALGIFIVLASLFAYPTFSGKRVCGHDTLSWLAMSEEARTWDKAHPSDMPLWSNSMFGGMPTYTHYQPGSNNLIVNFQHKLFDIIPNPIFFLLLAMLGFYVLMNTLHNKKWVSIIGAIAYAFAAYNIQIIAAGHNTKMFSIAYLPIALAGLIEVYRGNYIKGAALATLSFTLLFGNSMYQMVYYTLLVLGIMGIYYAVTLIKQGKAKQFVWASLIMLGSALIAVCTNLPVLLSTIEYSKTTMRGGQSELKKGKEVKKENGGLDKDYAFSWSESIGETFTLFVPNLFGGPLSTSAASQSKMAEVFGTSGDEENVGFASTFGGVTYWGQQPFVAGPFYYGILVLFLMVLGLFLIDNKIKWALFGIGIFGIMMSWGRHFPALNYFLFDHLPKYNNFRTPSMTLVIPQLLFGMLGFWGLAHALKEDLDLNILWDKIKKTTLIVGIITLVLTFMGGSLFGDFRGENDAKNISEMSGGNKQAEASIKEALHDDRSGMATKDGLRSLVFILLAAGTLAAYSRKKLDKKFVVPVLGVLIVFDLVGLGFRYLNANSSSYLENERITDFAQPRPVDQQILQDKDPYYRVLDLSIDPYNDATGAAMHKLVGGYHPAKMEIYQDLITYHLSKGFNGEVLNMLNTKYIISPQGKQLGVFPNPTANGPCWFVNTVKVLPDADAVIAALEAQKLGDTTVVPNPFNSKTTAIAQEKNWKKGDPTSYIIDSSSKISLTQYGLNNLKYESTNTQNGFAVFSDIYYDKGWKAYIDGKEAPITKVNYVLRGLSIPSGKHSIEFKFVPTTYLSNRKYALLASLIVLGLLGFLVWKGLNTKNEAIKNEV